MVTALNLKFDQSIEKSKVTKVSTEVGSLIPRNLRMGLTLGTLHTHTMYAKLNFPTSEGENPEGWV